MAYKRLANLTDDELNEQIVIQEQGINNKEIFSSIRLRNLLTERIRRYDLKLAMLKAELNGMNNQNKAKQ